MTSTDRLHRYLRRRDVLISSMGAVIVSILAACSTTDGSDDAPTAADRVEPQEPAASTATPAPNPSATPIPEVGFSNVADGSDLDIVRYEDLNAFGQYDEVQVTEEGLRHLIPLNAIEWGGVARDGIPALDSPYYVGPDRWYEMVYDPEGLVIGVEVDGRHRAYPLQILIWHEIVNETFDGKHLLVTY